MNDWIYHESDTGINTVGLAVNKTDMAPAFMTHALYWLLAFSFSLKCSSNFFHGQLKVESEEKWGEIRWYSKMMAKEREG